MNQRTLSKQEELQKCINAREQAEVELRKIQTHIAGLQDNCLGRQWWDGNILIRWSKHFNEERNQEVHLFPKDRIFSISSVFSQPSVQLLNIEHHILDNNELIARTFAKKNFQPISGRKKKKKNKPIRSLTLSQRKRNNRKLIQKREGRGSQPSK